MTTDPTTSPDRVSAAAGGLDATAYAELREIAARYPQGRSGLLPMLHLVQSIQNRITPEGIETCADLLGISAAEVSGVATFYTMYKRKPVGDYHVGVCTNTLCAVLGGDEIFERLKSHLDIGNDETTADGKITLEHIECNAACDYAPMMTVNWEFMDDMTPQSATALVDDLRAGVEVRSTRGPALCTWRQAERVLAGFPDGLADQGPSAGPASLVGLALARSNDWRAPDAAKVGSPGPESSEGVGDPAEAVPEEPRGAEKMQAAKDSDSPQAESDTIREEDVEND